MIASSNLNKIKAIFLNLKVDIKLNCKKDILKFKKNI